MNRASVNAAEREILWASQKWSAVKAMMTEEASRAWSRYTRASDVAEAAQGVDAVRVWADFLKGERARNLDHVKREWSGFLGHANRVLGKLQQGAKNAPSAAWFGTIIHLRRTDALLQYLHQARDASEHGDVIQGNDVVLRDAPANVRLSIAPGAPAHSAGIAFSTMDVPSIILLPVTTRSGTYQPPRKHLGKPMLPTVFVFAEAALAFLAKVVADANGRIV